MSLQANPPAGWDSKFAHFSGAYEEILSKNIIGMTRQKMTIMVHGTTIRKCNSSSKKNISDEYNNTNKSIIKSCLECITSNDNIA